MGKNSLSACLVNRTDMRIVMQLYEMLEKNEKTVITEMLQTFIVNRIRR